MTRNLKRLLLGVGVAALVAALGAVGVSLDVPGTVLDALLPPEAAVLEVEIETPILGTTAGAALGTISLPTPTPETSR